MNLLLFIWFFETLIQFSVGEDDMHSDNAENNEVATFKKLFIQKRIIQLGAIKQLKGGSAPLHCIYGFIMSSVERWRVSTVVAEITSPELVLRRKVVTPLSEFLLSYLPTLSGRPNPAHRVNYEYS